MKRNKKILAIIPARGGSKGLPKKNIKKLCGVPLIAYTIKAAQAARSLERIILSTDNEEIAKIVQKYGVEVPFMRPPELATDTALGIDNYIYTVERLNKEFGCSYSEFVVLQPTSPLRDSEDIDKAVQIFFEKKADSVISVAEMSHPPLWAKRISKKGQLINYFDSKIENQNRQELPKTFMPNGAIFVFKLEFLKKKYAYYSNKTYPYIMPMEKSIDIDTNTDFEFAEFMIRRQYNMVTKISYKALTNAVTKRRKQRL